MVPAGQVKAELCISTSGLNNYSLLVGPEVVVAGRCDLHLSIIITAEWLALPVSCRDLTSTRSCSRFCCRAKVERELHAMVVVVWPGRVMMCKLSNNRQPPLKSQKCRLQGLHRLNWSTKCVCSSVSPPLMCVVCRLIVTCQARYPSQELLHTSIPKRCWMGYANGDYLRADSGERGNSSNCGRRV